MAPSPLPSPPPPFSRQSSCLSPWPDTGGRGRSQIIRRWERLVLYNPLTTLCPVTTSVNCFYWSNILSMCYLLYYTVQYVFQALNIYFNKELWKIHLIKEKVYLLCWNMYPIFINWNFLSFIIPYFIVYSILLHLPPLGFNCVGLGGC